MSSGRSRLSRSITRSWLADHRFMAVALACGAILRGVEMLAYRPALLFPDAFRYLKAAHDFYIGFTRPTGYPLLLWPLVHITDSLVPITVIQHLMGLGLALASYAFLLRRGLPRWGATLAVLPLLLDPLQLVLEHYVLSDLLFSVLIGSACLILLWNPRPSLPVVLVVGVLVGYSGVVRGAGTFMIVTFLLAVVCLRVGAAKVVAFVVAAVVPVAAYAVAFHHTYGYYATDGYGPRFLYARLAPVVDCRGLELPDYERSLCPSEPVGQRRSTDYYMWGHSRGPQYHVRVPTGQTQIGVVKDFDKRVIRAEPEIYARAVLKDFAHGFEPSRAFDVPGYPASYWLFADHNWSLDPFIARGEYGADRLEGIGSNRTAAEFLTGYRRVLHTPGPLMALLLVLAAAAAAGLGRARLSGNRVAVGLLAGACVVPLLTGAAFSGFSWRYQLPQIMLLPVAGALAVRSLRSPRDSARPPLDPPVRVLDLLVHRAAPALVRGDDVDHEVTTSLHLLVAATAGALVGLVTASGAAISGWADPATAIVAGIAVAVLVASMLVISERRSREAEPPADSPDEPLDRPGLRT
jgi:hypothetical protein